MKRRQCGKSGLELPLLGIGCWAFGGGDYWGRQDQSDVDDLVHMSIERGCNFFDTAEVYNDGDSELSLGKALTDVPRDRVLICTKIAPANTATGVLKDHLEASLKRLGTDYVDIYMVHYPITPQSLKHTSSDAKILENPPSEEEAFEALTELKGQGKIRYIGISNYGVKQLSRVLETGVDIVVNQMAYNLFCRAIEMGVLPLCRKRGIGIIGFMPLLQGILAGKYHGPDEVPAARARTRHFAGSRHQSRHGEAGMEDLIFETLDWIRSLSREIGVSMADMAIAWCAANTDITCVLTGVRNVNQLEANIRSISIELSADVIRKLNERTAPILDKLGDSPDYWENRNNSRII